MGYGLMGVVNPPLQQKVEWPWFIVSQFVFGVVAAVVVVRSEKIYIPPAGTGPEQSGRVRGGVRRGSVVIGRSRYLLVVLIVAAGCDLPGKPRPGDRPVPPDQVLDFAALYGQNCAGCHGANGKLGPAPPLNNALFLTIVPDSVLQSVIAEGRPGTPMPAFAQSRGAL